MLQFLKRFVILSLFAVVALLAPSSVFASHSWGSYHWGRTKNPFTLKLGDNVTTAWDAYLATTASDWSVSTVLDTVIVAGQAKANCRPTKGRVEVCNKTYGNNGWLGLAQIWVSGSHITQATTKVNDTYFNTSTYNTPAWRNLVLCQEVGPTLGLDHQDEVFDNANLGTCMDYTSDPSSNQHPNAHDYEQLELIYAHLDTITTVSQTSAQLARQGVMGNQDAPGDDPGEWGQLVRKNGRLALYERDLGAGQKLFTFVIFAQ